RKGMRIARQHREAVTPSDAEVEQAAGQPIADRLHLGKGPAHAATDHRRPARLALRGAAQQIAETVLSCFLDCACGILGQSRLPEFLLPNMPLPFALGVAADRSLA